MIQIICVLIAAFVFYALYKLALANKLVPKNPPLGTANIFLLTGTPGSGKSLRAVEIIEDLIEDEQEVYVCNLNGCALPGIIPFEDPTRWQDLPPGSVLVIDEAQKFFRRRPGEPPAYIQAMETLRHVGVRLVFVTQQPSYLHAHILGLCGRHEHLLRKHGLSKTYIFRSEEVMENTRALRGRISADTQTWKFPTRLYSAYKSAEVHTHKFEMPSKWKKGLAFGGIAVFLFIAFGYRMYGDLFKGKPQGQAAAATKEGARATDAEVAAVPPGKEPLTMEQYLQRMVPRVPAELWTAPLFDGRAVASDPHVFCMSTPDNCLCRTEQGTQYDLELAACRVKARWGEAYNPFKRPQEVHELASTSPAAPAETSTAIPMKSDGPAGSKPYIGPVYVPPGQSAGKVL